MLAFAFPDRVARQDPANPRRYALSNGRGVTLHQNTLLFGERWLVAIDLRFDERDSLILAAAPFDDDLLERDFGGRFTQERIVRWNRDTRAVEAFEERRFAQLVLDRRSVPAKPEETAPIAIYTPLLLRTICDEAGNRIYSDADDVEIHEMDSGVVVTLFNAALALNRIGPEADDAEKKA